MKNTIRIYREVCNYISTIAYDEGCFNSVALHHLTYKEVRIKYDIPANFVVRARDKVVLTYKKNRKKLHVFKRLSIDLDNRLLSISSSSNEEVVVSIATINKRIKSKLVIDTSQKEFLKYPIIKARLTLEAEKYIMSIIVRSEHFIDKEE
ncbi:MAG: hypothetical protein JSW11_12405 [Candidatus Heimdallarchaeota archaeon]|nr:MAG: hypothetical protein JSW11_12405 [Candidatus Heimdallarchaeota archaeon]